MIISIRGASGSGKSTLVRRFARTWGPGVPMYRSGRIKPLYSAYENGLVVLGHYEIKNGGVDTLGTLAEAYDLARLFDAQGKIVLMEGKCMSDGMRHVVDLHSEGRDVRVVFLDTSFDDCVESVRLRGHKISNSSMERTYRKIQRDYDGMCRVPGLQLFRGTRDEGLAKLVEWTRCRDQSSLE